MTQLEIMGANAKQAARVLMNASSPPTKRISKTERQPD